LNTAPPRFRPTPTDRRILRLAFPALGALAVEPLYVLVDTAIVGRLGTDQLAGLALAATVLSFVIAGSNFLTYGTTERVARRHGAGDDAAAGDVGVQAIWLSLFVGVPVAPILALAAPAISRALGGSGAVLDHAVEYLRISAVGVPFVLVTLAAQGVLRGVANYRTPLLVLLAANAANVVIEIVLVFGLGLGIAGSAWSTVVSQFAAAVAFMALIAHHLRAASHRRPDWAGLRPLVTAGRHLLLRVGSMLAVFGGATAIAARIDAPTLAAHQVVMTLFLFLALSLDALAVPAQTLVAGELGGGSGPAAREIAHRVVRLSLVTGAGLAVVLLVAAPLLPAVFSPDPDVQDRATTGLVLLALMMVPAAVAFAHDGILIGAGDYRFLGLAALAYLVAVLPLGVAVLAVDDSGIAGIWGALLAWMVLRAVVNHRRTGSVLVAQA
jgi:putative MATE family efflux protein